MCLASNGTSTGGVRCRVLCLLIVALIIIRMAKVQQDQSHPPLTALKALCHLNWRVGFTFIDSSNISLSAMLWSQPLQL